MVSNEERWINKEERRLKENKKFNKKNDKRKKLGLDVRVYPK